MTRLGRSTLLLNSKAPEQMTAECIMVINDNIHILLQSSPGNMWLIRSFCEFFFILRRGAIAPPANDAPDQTVKNLQNIIQPGGGPTLQECLDSSNLRNDTLFVTRWAVLDNFALKNIV